MSNPPALRDYPWRIGYASDTHNPIVDFYIPALERASQYDRKAGFFNSAILSSVARGIGAMLAQQGKIRLIMGCQFSPQDIAAIRQGYSLRDALNAPLDRALTPPQNWSQLKHFELLSWLIEHNYLDLRIAIPLKSDGSPEDPTTQLAPERLFHEKVGIITDGFGDRLAFSGSNNESLGGWYANVESFHVYLDWEGGRDRERVELETERFDRLWANQTPNVAIFTIPDAVRQRLLRYTPKQAPIWQQELEFDLRSIVPSQLPADEVNSVPLVADDSLDFKDRQDACPTVAEIEDFQRLHNLHTDPGCLAYVLHSIPIQPWLHQLKILYRYVAEFPRNSLIADEVGLGKTIETGLILRYLLVSQKAKRILILAPASVQPQWQSELREKFNLHFHSFSQGELLDPFGQSIPLADNPWDSHHLILASSHLVRRQDRMRELLASQPWDLVILDETHHARRKSPQNRQDTPNRLLELMRQLKDRTQALLLLSATPMQIDPIEIFDLLHLLGLSGHWQYGDNFCNYFHYLTQSCDPQILAFWQQLSVDYFTNGGKPCPRIQQYWQSRDRLLASKLSDTWQRGRKITNPRQMLADETFITASRQFLTANNPLKDLMFRHTRDTLRQYYRLGVLAKDIPQREVWDVAITLEPLREADLYRSVSSYVRDFYRLAQKQNRKALGFLMTLYRKRLTSSFYAIQQSLTRRLNDLLTGKPTSLSVDDLLELDDLDDSAIDSLAALAESVHPQEIEYLQDLLRQFDRTGEDTKCAQFLKVLRCELQARDSAIVFTQYTDTMDYLREFLQASFGTTGVACYSGRGGELYQDSQWKIVPKEKIKSLFRDGKIDILLCTESASEGLNLQTCGVLINYDLPWNPMRVEQRIGRIDRIGQRYPTVRIHNFYYDGTVEAKVYRRLRERIDAFATVVGNLQPILAQVPTFIERAVMSADPEEEDVLLSEFEQILDTPPLRPALDEMLEADVRADLAETSRPFAPTTLTNDRIEALFTSSVTLKSKGVEFISQGDRCWQLIFQNKPYLVTFYPEVFEERSSSLRLLAFGDPLFDRLLALTVAQSDSIEP
jgi:ERCC4-related helicase